MPGGGVGRDEGRGGGVVVALAPGYNVSIIGPLSILGEIKYKGMIIVMLSGTEYKGVKEDEGDERTGINSHIPLSKLGTRPSRTGNQLVPPA